MKYYEHEHFEAYARIRAEGLDQWNDLHEGDSARGYDNFAARDFLESALPEQGAGRTVFEYGCGTGGAACFMAQRGYMVHAIDLVPDAIHVAREHASDRELDVEFEVGDICDGAAPREPVDFVVDCFCLQSIVADEDRSATLDGVHRSLKTGGLYLLATAMFEPERAYGSNLYDGRTGIVWTQSSRDVEGARLSGHAWYAPVRRHLTAAALQLELEQHELEVIFQSGPYGGEVICAKR